MNSYPSSERRHRRTAGRRATRYVGAVTLALGIAVGAGCGAASQERLVAAQAQPGEQVAPRVNARLAQAEGFERNLQNQVDAAARQRSVRARVAQAEGFERNLQNQVDAARAARVVAAAGSDRHLEVLADELEARTADEPDLNPRVILRW